MSHIRTALEHAYVLAILSQEKEAGVEFMIEWAQRMEVTKLKKLEASTGGDEEDKKAIRASIEELLKRLGKAKVAQATVYDLVERANLKGLHSFFYSSLSPYAHFDPAKTLAAAYERIGDVPDDLEESNDERDAEALYMLLGVLIHLGIARRDLGDQSIADAIERCVLIYRRHEEAALQASADSPPQQPLS